MKSARVEMHRIAGAIRRAGAGAPDNVVAAHYRAPTLAEELGSKCSAALLEDLSERLHAVPPNAVPSPCDLAVLERLDRLHSKGGVAGVLLGLATGSILGGLFEFPIGLLIGAIGFPGPVLAVCGPLMWRYVLVAFTPLGRKAVLIAYGVHLRTLERHLYWNSLTWQQFERAVVELFPPDVNRFLAALRDPYFIAPRFTRVKLRRCASKIVAGCKTVVLACSLVGTVLLRGCRDHAEQPATSQ